MKVLLNLYLKIHITKVLMLQTVRTFKTTFAQIRSKKINGAKIIPRAHLNDDDDSNVADNSFSDENIVT